MLMFSVRYSLYDDTECRDPVHCIAHTVSTRRISPAGNRIPVYTSNTTRSIYGLVRSQDFTLRSISGLPSVRGTAGIQYQYVARRVFHSSMLQYFQLPYSGYTLSPRHNWPPVVLLTYSQYSLYYGLQYTPKLSVLAARKKCTRYSENTWNICCDAGCCSCGSCC